MATQNQNTWETLYNGLSTNEKNASDGNEVLKKLDELHAIAATGSSEDFNAHVQDLLQTYGQHYGLSSELNGEDILREANSWRDANFPNTNFAQSQSEFDQPPQQGAGVVGGFIEGLTKDRNTAPSAGGGRTPDAATNAVQSLQEQELLKEFNDALERGDQDKIKRLFEDSEVPGKLDIHKLLADQLEKAHTHLDLLTPEELKLAHLDGTTQARDKEGNLMFDEHGKPIMITKVQAMHNEFDRQAKLQDAQLKKQEDKQLTLAEKEAKAKQEAQEKQWQEKALNGTDERNRKAAFRSLLQSRLNQARSYSLFNEYYANEQDLALVPLFQLMGNQRQVVLRQRAAQAQQEEQQHADEGLSTQHTQAANAARSVRQAAKNKTLKKFLDKGVGAAAKLAGPQAQVGWWLFKFIMKHKTLTAILVALLVSIVFMPIIVLIVVIVGFFGQGNTTQAQLQPTCTTTVDCLQKLQALGVTVNFVPKYPYNPENKIKDTYDTLAFVSQSPSQFLQLLKLPKQPITIVYHGGGCAGHASGSGTVDLYGDCLSDTNRFMLIHELGHEIAFRNPDLYNKFLNQFSFLLDGIINPFTALPTFNCQFDYGHGPFAAECFADMIGEYPVYHTYRNTVTGPLGVQIPVYTIGGRDFSTYPGFYLGNYYNFAKTNIFGGVTF